MRFVKVLSVVLVTGMTFGAFAGFSWFSNGPKRRLETVIVTANYKSPRLIAELIQNESRQTYLLFPAKGGEDRVIFCSPKVNKQVLRSKIAAAIRVLNPKRVIILGDENYLWVRKMRDKAETVNNVKGKKSFFEAQLTSRLPVLYESV